MICYICQKEFVSKHFNQKLCSVECKKEATKQVKKRYKQTEKGRKSYDRWCKNPTKKEIDKNINRLKSENQSKIQVKAFRQKILNIQKDKLRLKEKEKDGYDQRIGRKIT